MKGRQGAGTLRFLVFQLDANRYGLTLAAVERTVRVVEITPLPKAPEIVLGIINVEGRVVPVVDIRERFRRPKREVRLDDQIILARTSRRNIGLLVDRAEEVVERAENEVAKAEAVLPGLKYVQGVVKLRDGLILIHDLETFLSLDEEAQLTSALARTGT
jgi:purine-binding chemotaxis protein CheW